MKTSTPRSLPVMLPIITFLGGCLVGAWVESFSLQRRGYMLLRESTYTETALDVAVRLENGLKSDDPGQRCLAASILARMGYESASLPVLVECLKSSDLAVKLDAALQLSSIGPPAAPAVDDLRRALGDESAEVRRFCAIALGRIGPEASAAVPDLLKLASQEQAENRRAVVQALAGIGDLQALRAAFHDPEPSTTYAAILAAGLMGADGADAVPDLVSILSSADAPLEQQAIVVEALGTMGPTAAPAIPALFSTLGEHGSDIGGACVAAIGRTRDATTVLPYLDDADSEIRGGAIAAIGIMGDAGAPAVPKLIACLSDEDRRARYTALTALIGVGPSAKAAIPEITKLLDDPEAPIREAASRALAIINGSEESDE